MRHQVVSGEEWLKARLELLAADKKLTRQRDALTRRQVAMLWERVDKSCQFEGPNVDLRSPISSTGAPAHRLSLHIRPIGMFDPDWEEGCRSCSFWADNFNGIPIHLNHRDVTFTAVSRALLPKTNAYTKRMVWSFPWVSSYSSDFNFDYHASFTPEQIGEGKACCNYEVRLNTLSDEVGVSVFYKNERGGVVYTYSCNSRGDFLPVSKHFFGFPMKGPPRPPTRIRWSK